MVRVIALTQFAFLALGIVSLKIMLHAQTAVSPYLETLNQWVLALFAVPLVWIAFASICAHVERGPLTSPVARAVGVLVAIASFGFLATVTFFT